MKQLPEGRINGIFVGLSRHPLRIVFRRRIDHHWERYDVYKPFEKIDGVVEILNQLLKEQSEFAQSMVNVDTGNIKRSSFRTNHYVATDREMLYRQERDDLVRKYSRRIGPLWLATNLNGGQKMEVIKEACEAAEIEFGLVSALKL